MRLEPCDRCGDKFSSRELNDICLCPRCVEEEEQEQEEQSNALSEGLRAMSNNPDE